MGDAASLTISVAEAAEQLGAPKAVVLRVADDIGALIVFGNRKRIDPRDLPEIMDACRSKPKAPASTAGKTPASTKSGTPGEGTVRRAQEIAEKLKGRSRSTSPKGTAAPVVPLVPKKS